MAPQLNKSLEGEHGDVADPVNRLAVSVGLAAFFFTTNPSATTLTTGGIQYCHQTGMPLPMGKISRCLSLIVTDIHIRFRLDQNLGSLHPILQRCPM